MMKYSLIIVNLLFFTIGGESVLREYLQHETFDNEVCYEHYGCFSDGAPWSGLLRPLAGNPKPPYEVGTRFLLFTRSNKFQDFELIPDNKVILDYSTYDMAKKTVMLIHGFTDSHLTNWMMQAKNALLDKEDINVISVDWSPGASRYYLTAVNNARMVGAQLTRFLKFLVAEAELDLSTVRIIGHSIGAHIAGYVGHELSGKLGYITGLDPADPYFGGTHPIVRLDVTDALNVQIIHTNTESVFGMGIKPAIGDVDFYVNGGQTQPGCNDGLGGLIGSILKLISWDWDRPFEPYVCSHYRAAELYIESIKSPCPFVAHKCNTYTEFKTGRCPTLCTRSGSCAILGYKAQKSSIRGSYYLDTESKNPYCLQSVQFDSSYLVDQGIANGKVVVQLETRHGLTEKLVVHDGKLSGGQIVHAFLDIPSRIMLDPTEEPQLIVRYDRSGVFQPRYIELEAISLHITKADLKISTVRYPSTTFEHGRDITLFPTK